MAMGVKKPGFQLLSLSPTPSGITAAKTLSDAPCLLPDQLGIYLSIYVPFIVVSLISLLVSNAARVRSSAYLGAASHFGNRRTITGEDTLSSSSSVRKLSALSLPMRRFDDDEEDIDSDAPYILPPPTPAVRITGKDKRLQRTRLTICGRTVDISAFRRLLHYVGFSRHGGTTSRRKRRGLLVGLVDDVLSVAWMPVVLFVAIAWAMFL